MTTGEELIELLRADTAFWEEERYEREMILHAFALFNGGRGGTADQPWVQQRLAEQLRPLLRGPILEEEACPFWPISSGGRGIKWPWSRFHAK